MQSGCGGNAKVYLSSSVGSWKGGTTLKTADINFMEGTSKVKITLKLEKDVSPGKPYLVKILFNESMQFRSI